MHRYLPFKGLLERIFLSELDLGVRLVTSNSEAVRATLIENSLVALTLRCAVAQNIVPNLLLVRAVHEIGRARHEEHGDVRSHLLEGFEIFGNLQERRVGDHTDRDSLLNGETDGVLALCDRTYLSPDRFANGHLEVRTPKQ